MHGGALFAVAAAVAVGSVVAIGWGTWIVMEAVEGVAREAMN